MAHPDKTDNFQTLSSDPVIDAYKKDVDRTLVRESLRLTVDERFQQLMKLQQFAEELQRAGKETKSGQ